MGQDFKNSLCFKFHQFEFYFLVELYFQTLARIVHWFGLKPYVLCPIQFVFVCLSNNFQSAGSWQCFQLEFIHQSLQFVAAARCQLNLVLALIHYLLLVNCCYASTNWYGCWSQTHDLFHFKLFVVESEVFTTALVLRTHTYSAVVSKCLTHLQIEKYSSHELLEAQLVNLLNFDQVAPNNKSPFVCNLSRLFRSFQFHTGLTLLFGE